MVTKGEIQSIDYQGNTCIVRLPYFESAGIKDNIQAEATINNQPGMYNGYKAGDIVWVAFEDGEASQPVVIGKLYLGANKERNDPRGVVNAESSIISNNIQLPITTKIVYETDGTVAQNGITRYNTLSDITNELGKLSGKQSLTTVDMAGLTTTANQIKAEVSSIKAQTESKSDYIQAEEPKSLNYVEWAAYKQFTSADQYVGFYINIGTETERKYIEITDENKEVWITNPGKQAAYKEQELKENNTWLYTGDDLYEKEDQPANTANITDFIGCYVYCTDDESESLADKDPSETTCPVSSGHHTQDPKCYKADKGYKFVLISSDNKSKITDIKNTAAYKIHLAKNTAFRVASIKNNIVTWEETTLSYIKGFASSITQTDKSIDAKVSKKYNDDTTADFGWLIEQQDDIEKDKKSDDYKAGDEYGKFVVYSDIEYSDISKKSPGKIDVFHANRNGITITGNLEVQDSDNQKIFRALPYGEVSNTDSESGKVTYDGNPQVQIGGFTIDKDTLTSKETGVSIGPEGLSVNNSSSKNQFSVLTDGTTWGKKLYIEQDEKHDNAGNADSYFDGNVCGHQVKVDTVELATTNTDDGIDQTDGFRVEKYKVTGKLNSSTYEVTFAIDDVYTKRDNSGNLVSGAPYCVLADKQISAAVKLKIKTQSGDIRNVTISVTGKLKGYPFSSDGSWTSAQSKFSSDKQAAILAKIALNSGKISVFSKSPNSNSATGDADSDYSDWAEVTVTGLEGISNCASIESGEILSWTPEREEFFTGDFIATTGFFKDKHGCFSESMLCDLFSMPWKYPTKQYDEDTKTWDVVWKDVEARIVKIDNTYLAYKELTNRCICTVLSSTKMTPTFNLSDCSMSDDSEKVTILPGLSDFTSIRALNCTPLKKYSYLYTLSKPVNDYDTASAAGCFADSIANTWYTSVVEYVTDGNMTSYSISPYSFGYNLITSDTTTKLDGVQISLMIDDIPEQWSVSNNNITRTPKKIIAFSSNSFKVKRGNTTIEITGISSEALSLQVYGSNAAAYYDTTTKMIVEQQVIKGSGAYLRETNAVQINNPTTSGCMSTIISTNTNKTALSSGKSISRYSSIPTKQDVTKDIMKWEKD